MFKRILSMILCITLVCLIAMPVTADETKETKQIRVYITHEECYL